MLLWYAAYGSNILKSRFLAYLRGGPVPGTDRTQAGARDPADPLDDQPFRLPFELLFGRHSTGWGGGGVAFVDPGRVESEPRTMGRAWLVTVEQLADVCAQENDRAAVSAPEIDVERLRSDGSLQLDRGWYDRLYHLGELDGLPVATITCETAPAPNPPHQAYLTIMGRGLVETWGLPVDETVAYLASQRGATSSVDTEALAVAIEAGLEST